MKSARLVACTIAFVACVSAYAGNAGPYAVCDTLLPKIETDSAAVKAGDNVAAARIMACAYTSRSRADIQQEILETSHILWRLPGMYLCTDVEPADVQGLFAGL